MNQWAGSAALHSVDLSIPTAVAVSGGVDSMTLLTTLAQQTPSHPLYAFYIHHDLQTLADDWLRQVQVYCAHIGVAFDSVRLDARTRQSAQSIEEWARIGRYHALSTLARTHQIRQIVLAHHQDDQIETHLIQKNRGAGARGLAAMPAQIERDGVVWLRPWLNVTRAQIVAAAQAQCIPYVHDPSNDDTRFARNAIRAQFAAQPMSEAQRQAILNAITSAQTQLTFESDWAKSEVSAHIVAHRAEIGECARLRGVDLNQYNAPQRNWLLREWFAQLGWRMPSQSALSELIKQLSNTDPDQQMCWRHSSSGGAITQFQGDWIAAQLRPHGQWWLTEPIRAMISAQNLSIRPRIGGERVRLAASRPRMSLKQAYQEHHIAPMLRAQLPLLYAGERLVYVVGVGAVLYSDDAVG